MEEQINGFLKEAEAGLPIKELRRKHGFSHASFYTWRAKSGCMKVSEAPAEGPRIGERTAEELLAEAMLDMGALMVVVMGKP